ncbi:hypothetical protein L227DRAFT_572094 [Lentinus tigrinus ALCF2SS1-6]|uniref:Uncharacterized protein n=1 Tax=Lentinus tigrinus ALCF2SS1-6 TaxID=1328759 RepID=A0A5C2SK42_9APHY|nr:hypothetical protein L227DRAFT_572094 [Lentinus tigrinus ALCF2SS1-6]
MLIDPRMDALQTPTTWLSRASEYHGHPSPAPFQVAVSVLSLRATFPAGAGSDSHLVQRRDFEEMAHFSIVVPAVIIGAFILSMMICLSYRRRPTGNADTAMLLAGLLASMHPQPRMWEVYLDVPCDDSSEPVTTVFSKYASITAPTHVKDCWEEMMPVGLQPEDAVSTRTIDSEPPHSNCNTRGRSPSVIPHRLSVLIAMPYSKTSFQGMDLPPLDIGVLYVRTNSDV